MVQRRKTEIEDKNKEISSISWNYKWIRSMEDQGELFIEIYDQDLEKAYSIFKKVKNGENGKNKD